MFWGILGTFHFSFFGLRGGAKSFGRVARGGEKFWTRREGGANIFGRVTKGGRKILDLTKKNLMCVKTILKHFIYVFRVL